jgi:uncharacterized integral membrane protein
MATDHAETRRRTAADVVRLVVVLALIAAIVLIAVDNRHDTEVGYVIGDVEAPLWVVLVAAGLAGIVIGWLVRHRPHRD